MNRFKRSLVYVLSVHILALFVLSLLRVVLLITNLNSFSASDFPYLDITTALTKGVWFDNVIACYISITPIVVFTILGLSNKIGNNIVKILNAYYVLLYGLVFSISVANIPYFNYFFKHLNSSIFNWAEEGGEALSMILQEKSYYTYFFIFLLTYATFIYIVTNLAKKIIRTEKSTISRNKYLIYIPLCVVIIASTILGIRGRFGRNPIKTSQAYFCNNSFLNQLGLNPTFFLMRSVLESSKKHISANRLMDEKSAIMYVQKELGIAELTTHLPSPIFRSIEGNDENQDVNIVIILMESMSADLLRKENGKLTPYLNKLKEESYYFENFYSTGTHTNHGVIATLFGIPSLFDKNMMKNVDIPHCQGIPSILKKRGYTTSFFVTHESQYDNMNAFLLENGIEEMYAQENYPKSKVANGFGVQDDYLFEYALDKLNKYAKEEKPFFSTILTISNHPPYIVPDKYKNTSSEAEDQIVAFADDAIHQFMETAKKQPWYNNTIFVLLGDHGKIVGIPTYDIPLSYNHVPMIIHSPLLTDSPKKIDKIAGQIDVFPTILGLLNYSYQNNTLGIDLLREERSHIFFTSDDMMGCINDKFLYTYDPTNNIEKLYEYKEKKTESCLETQKEVATNMSKYAASMLITTDYMLKKKLTRISE